MRNLYLLRHAEREPSTDFDTSLTENGFVQAKQLGNLIEETAYHFDTVLCSSAKRTRQTLEELKLPASTDITYSDAIFSASPGDLLDMIQDISSNKSTPLIIGHNPTLSALVQYLANNDSQSAENIFVGNCGFKEIRLDIESWSDIQPHSGSITHLFPQTLS